MCSSSAAYAANEAVRTGSDPESIVRRSMGTAMQALVDLFSFEFVVKRFDIATHESVYDEGNPNVIIAPIVFRGYAEDDSVKVRLKFDGITAPPTVTLEFNGEMVDSSDSSSGSALDQLLVHWDELENLIEDLLSW